MEHFIPLPYKKEGITIRIDVNKLRVIEDCCSAYQINRSEFINRCIDFALIHMPASAPNDAVNLPPV